MVGGGMTARLTPPGVEADPGTRSNDDLTVNGTLTGQVVTSGRPFTRRRVPKAAATLRCGIAATAEKPDGSPAAQRITLLALDGRGCHDGEDRGCRARRKACRADLPSRFGGRGGTAESCGPGGPGGG